MSREQVSVYQLACKCQVCVARWRQYGMSTIAREDAEEVRYILKVWWEEKVGVGSKRRLQINNVPDPIIPACHVFQMRRGRISNRLLWGFERVFKIGE